MPGTILVSVLEFMGLPLPSSASLTVSMGKTVYQVSEKGDFSFPLTSLRNDLIVLLQDVDGNEIWRTGIEAMSIVEKGVWEDFFPLGSGHLHLKLQFNLNDQEREKIRIMRQSALKKTHDELLDSSPTRAESATTSALPLCTNVEVSDQNIEMPSTASVSQAVDHTQLQPKGVMKKPAIHSPSMEDPQRAICLKEMAISLGRSEQNIASMDNLIDPNMENSLDYPEKQNPLGKTPSNVRKMISAFECGLVQDTRSHIKPPPTKCQFSEIETNAYSTNWHLKDYEAQDTEHAGFLKGRIRGAPHAGELQHAPESREQFNLHSDVPYKETKQLKDLSTKKILNKQTDSTERDKFKVTYKTDIEEEKYNKELMNTSTFETLTVSGKMQDIYSGRNHPGELFKGASPRKLDSVIYFEDKFYSAESSGAWILPDEQKRFCLQAGGEILMDLSESQVKRHISHQRSLDFSIIQVSDKNATSSETGTGIGTGTGTEVSSHGEIHKIEESKTKNWDDKISAGPVNQVIKVAIIVGFGILVLLTRQRKSR